MKQLNWPTLAINGVIAVLFGVLTLFFPSETILVVVKYFAILIALAGIIIITVALTNRKNQQSWSFLLLQGIAAAVIGILILVFTRETLDFFVILIGVWAIILGILMFVLAFSLKGPNSDRTSVILSGVLAIGFGLLLFFNPFESATIFITIIGILALIVGVMLIYFAFRIKRLEKEI